MSTELIPNYFRVSEALDPPCCSDLDQLTEIMKTTGTPSQEFIAKLESEDVSREHAGELYCDIAISEKKLFTSSVERADDFIFVCYLRLEATSKVFREWKRKTFTLWFLSLILRVGFTQPLDDTYLQSHTVELCVPFFLFAF